MSISAIPTNFPENDPARPNFVWAPGLTRGVAPLCLFVPPRTIRGLLDDRLNAKVGEYVGLVHGNFNNFGGTTGLAASVALFAGLKRPMITDERDVDIHVYITNPKRTYTYRQYDQNPTEHAAPFNSVFATYVDANPEAISSARNLTRESSIDGVVAFWEWLIADPSDPSLPENFGRRYLRRQW